MTSSECLSPGELARIMGGKASRRERRTWMIHLDGCLDCRMVQADAASYLEEASALVGRRSATGSFRNLFRVPLWAVAASLLAAVLVPIVLRTASGRLGPNSTAVSEVTGSSVTSALPIADTAHSEHRWRASERGLGFDSGVTETERAFRAGVYVVDLNVAVRERRSADTAAILEELLPLVSASGDSDALAAVRREVETGALDAIRAALVALESHVRETTNETFFALGVWSEAARLAAVAGDASYFQSDPFATGLSTFRELELPNPLPARLDAIKTLTDGGVSESELSSLRRGLRNLILLN